MWKLVSRKVRTFVFLLLAFALSFSLLFRLYLRIRILQYQSQNGAGADQSSERGNGLEQLSFQEADAVNGASAAAITGSVTEAAGAAGVGSAAANAEGTEGTTGAVNAADTENAVNAADAGAGGETGGANSTDPADTTGAKDVRNTGSATGSSDPLETQELRDFQAIYSFYTEDLEMLEQETAALESRETRQGGLSLRERKKRAADLWNNELQRMAEDIARALPDEEARQDFHMDQRNFFSARRHTLMKELGSGVEGSTESIAYLTSYAALTRERCYELLDNFIK